jgi:hypothetical protein
MCEDCGDKSSTDIGEFESNLPLKSCEGEKPSQRQFLLGGKALATGLPY